MKRMDMKNTVETEFDLTLDVEGIGNAREVMRDMETTRTILYLGGYDYTIGEVMSIFECIGFIAIDEGKGVPPGVTDKEFIDVNNKIHQVMKEDREAGDQEYMIYISEAKEYVDQFLHDMGESIKILQKNGLIPGISTPKSHSRMYG